jgi:hypothetical protein
MLMIKLLAQRPIEQLHIRVPKHRKRSLYRKFP